MGLCWWVMGGICFVWVLWEERSKQSTHEVPVHACFPKNLASSHPHCCPPHGAACSHNGLSLPTFILQLFGFVYACYVSKVFLEEEDSCECLCY